MRSKLFTRINNQNNRYQLYNSGLDTEYAINLALKTIFRFYLKNDRRYHRISF